MILATWPKPFKFSKVRKDVLCGANNIHTGELYGSVLWHKHKNTCEWVCAHEFNSRYYTNKHITMRLHGGCCVEGLVVVWFLPYLRPTQESPRHLWSLSCQCRSIPEKMQHCSQSHQLQRIPQFLNSDVILLGHKVDMVLLH